MIERELTERRVKRIREGIAQIRVEHPDLAHGYVQDLDMMEQLLTEALSDSDWTKIAVIAGIAWSRMDVMIRALENINSNLKDVARELGRR